MCDPSYQICDFVSRPICTTLYYRIVLLVWTSHVLYTTTIRRNQFSSRNLVSNLNFINFSWFSRFSCELNIWSGMEKTFEPKLEAKPNFPGPLVSTSACAWTCSIWFLRHQQISRVGSREIFEKHPKCETALTKSSTLCHAQFAPRCTIE